MSADTWHHVHYIFSVHQEAQMKMSVRMLAAIHLKSRIGQTPLTDTVIAGVYFIAAWFTDG